MTLDQSLANLQHQADRLASIFERTADAIEADPHPYVGADPVAAYAGGVADAMAPTKLQEAVQPPTKGDFEPNYVDQMPTATANYPMPPREERPAEPTTWASQAAKSAEQLNAPEAVTGSPAEYEAVSEPPVNPTTMPPEGQHFTASNPFETAPNEPTEVPAKKGGRRTNEELAAEAGVRLEDVKAWHGEGRITKGVIEDFAKKNPEKAVMNNQQLSVTAVVPVSASDPFGQGSTSAPVAPTEPVEDPWAPQADGQPTPVQATPEDPFGQAPGADEAITDWNPFQ